MRGAAKRQASHTTVSGPLARTKAAPHSANAACHPRNMPYATRNAMSATVDRCAAQVQRAAGDPQRRAARRNGPRTRQQRRAARVHPCVRHPQRGVRKGAAPRRMRTTACRRSARGRTHHVSDLHTRMEAPLCRPEQWRRDTPQAA